MRIFVQRAQKQGARIVREPWEEKDEDGVVRMASIQTFGDTTHTFLDRSKYTGPFLPGYKLSERADPLANQL